MRALLLTGVTVLAVASCGKDPATIATLRRADGPIDKQIGTGPWTPASPGTKFHFGDGALTGDGAAALELLGGAELAMQPHTRLRFGGTAGGGKISVEVGSIELAGTGAYGLALGEVTLSRGRVRIGASGSGDNTVELLMGDATITSTTGTTLELTLGQIVDLSSSMEVSIRRIDGGVPDAAPVDAGIDAAIDAGIAPEDGAAIVVAGKKAEVLLPGAAGWAPLTTGAGMIPKGAKIRAASGTTVTLTSRGTSVELSGGARATLGDDLVLRIEDGDSIISAPANTEGQVLLPGGSLTLVSRPTGGSAAKVAVGPRDSRVTVARGGAKLSGSTGGELAMERGETANLAKTGTIRVIEKIPGYHDFRVSAGETYTIHDPKGATAVQFAFEGKCSDGGIVELDRDARFRTARVSGGKDSANLMIPAGGWAYRLRCTSGEGDGASVASGRIAVMRDAGTRRLLKDIAFDIDTDGRTYSMTYQSTIPSVAVRIRGGGGPFTLHLAQGGVEETFTGPGPKITIPGSKLKEGTYTYWIDRNGARDPKTSTLKVDFNNTAPQVYIEAPSEGRAWGDEIEIRGAVLPGWSASIDGVAMPIDKQRRFVGKISRPSGGAIAIRLSHPQRGVHYYLRRGK